jgi:hypothetical protein
MGNLLSFKQAIEGLGKTGKERAKALGVSETIYYEMKRGKIPRYITRLVQRPALLEALLDDARAGRTNGNHDEAA